MENKIRNTLNEIYFDKTHNVVSNLRSVTVLSDQKRQEALRSDLAQALQKRASNNNNAN